ncbi:MAG: caspase family protein, partial [Anaerolineae bacterium]
MTTTSPFPAKRALLIGIGRYAHLPPERQLHGPPADVAALADLLTNAHAFDHITTLVDEQATRKAILNAFADLVDATQPGDLVLIHYSGHGSRVPDIHGDEADGWDSSLVPHDGRDPDGLAPDILDDELNPFFGRLVNERQAGDLVLIFDSCHSAGMTRADGDAPFPAWSRSLEPPTPVAGSRLVESAAAASAAPPPMWQPAGEQFIAFYACQGAESAFEL